MYLMENSLVSMTEKMKHYKIFFSLGLNISKSKDKIFRNFSTEEQIALD